MAKRSWIQKLDDGLALAADEEMRQAVMAGSESLTSGSSPGTKAKWVHGAMAEMDRMLSEDQRIQVMERCSCDFEKRKREARRAYEDSEDIDDFIKRLGNRCNHLERQGDILYCTKTGECDCGWVRATKTPMLRTYCHCGKGYIMKYFEAAFQRPVKVDLLKSIICGDDICQFAIHLEGEPHK